MENLHFSPLPLGRIRIEDKTLQNAYEKEVAFLLSLEAERLLAGFYQNAGIPTPFSRYGGWESTLIGGHTLGHYLSALSYAVLSAEGEVQAALLGRMRFILLGLETAQNAIGTGLIWGAMPLAGGIEAQFDNVEQGKTDLTCEAWVPWYTLHKLLSGLIDCAVCTAAEELRPLALHLATRLGDWIAARVLPWDEDTRERVLSVEYGGMNDALYLLFDLTGEERYAAAAHVFDEEALFEGILEHRKDFLDGKHANTTIPKFLGALRRYLVLNGKQIGGKIVDATRYLHAAEAFFETVTKYHTYATGANSEWEHFGRDGILDAERTACNAETCNVYNMRKLACGLFSATGRRMYLDYDENAFTNAILASQNPETGMTTYFQPMASGYFKVFSHPYDNFWCCTGSGMENFSKLAQGIFYTDGTRLVVARWTACTLNFHGATVHIACALPFDPEVSVEVRGELTLLLRIPDWCASPPEITLDGKKIAAEGDFYEVHMRDSRLVMRFPIKITAEGLPDGADVFAFKYGGTLLAADLGAGALEETTTGVGVRIPKEKIGSEEVEFPDPEDVRAHPERYLAREGEGFRLKGERPLVFLPYARCYRGRYAIYLRLKKNG